MSTDYYDQHANTFFEQTVEVDMTPLWERFLAHIPAGGHILDAGCGSGRDARAFRDQGYQITAFDGSAELARLATEYLGCPVRHLQFQALDYTNCFDGIWACASLLHVPYDQLNEVLRRFTLALKPGGVWYLSFKWGQGEREHQGRRFTDLDEAGLNRLLAGHPALEMLEIWPTADRRPGRDEERWLNALLRRRPIKRNSAP